MAFQNKFRTKWLLWTKSSKKDFFKQNFHKMTFLNKIFTKWLFQKNYDFFEQSVTKRVLRTKFSQNDFFEQNCHKLTFSNKILTNRLFRTKLSRFHFIFFCERSKVIKNENVGGDVIKKISAAKKINTLKWSVYPRSGSTVAWLIELCFQF